ncbi:hypothetical protein Ahy_B10g105406 [Arachis hypogaea]|uniref:Uncharacterized protein n=1 Tax=Arachis hypogaea TaxID=3818 RepID=A0A444X7X1_ARAHY|nr:hypothetical protein Ahy_B10g105406 [Arachis hypogaea]
MLVHPSPPYQCRIKLIDEIRREDYNPLPSTRRPNPINEVQQPRKRYLTSLLLFTLSFLQWILLIFLIFLFLLLLLPLSSKIQRAVNVLNYDNRLPSRLNQQLPQLGVLLHSRQFKIIHIISLEPRRVLENYVTPLGAFVSVPVITWIVRVELQLAVLRGNRFALIQHVIDVRAGSKGRWEELLVRIS